MSTVRDDIASRLDAEQQAIEAEGGTAMAKHADDLRGEAERHQIQVEAIDRAYADAIAPLRGRAMEVETIRAFLASTSDPQQPSATGDATTSATDEQPAPASEQSAPATPSDEPSTPTPEPEPTPSTESGDASPAPLPTASPDEALQIALSADTALDTPLAVPLTTGSIAVVSAQDVLAAHDEQTEDAALTTAALDLRRNSDWP